MCGWIILIFKRWNIILENSSKMNLTVLCTKLQDNITDIFEILLVILLSVIFLEMFYIISKA